MTNELEMIKLIKMYVLHHPNCTARQISEYFIAHKFGIRIEYNTQQIVLLIKKYSKHNTNSYHWFNVEEIHTGNRSKRYIVRE